MHAYKHVYMHTYKHKEGSDMKNKNKGFTLIELLVVVAIIGILAAVGTVAYTGYTKSAKKNASGSNHATVVKYIAAELQKCNLETSAFKPASGAAMACNTKTTATAAAATTALGDFKNPYDPTADAVTTGAVYDAEGGTAAVSATSGNTVVSQSTIEVSVSTCIADDGATPAVCELKTNTVSIE